MSLRLYKWPIITSEPLLRKMVAIFLTIISFCVRAALHPMPGHAGTRRWSTRVSTITLPTSRVKW